jgi:CO dehydrogenase/acetyl-CoA synthase beta subunit
MVTIVKRGNELYALTDDIMVSAFLANGWERYTPTPSGVKEPVVETKVEEPKEQSEVTDDLDSKSLKELRAIAKEKGINSFHKNAETLREEIRNA